MVPSTAPIAANLKANKANAARSSRTKHRCMAPSSPRNHLIHLRLLSLVFILSSILGPCPLLALTCGLSAPAGLRPSCCLLDALTCPSGLLRSYLYHLTALGPPRL